MNKEIIEKYIQFAIDNGFKIKQLDIIRYCLFSNTGAGYCELYIHFDYGKNNSKNINIIELITSKEFIEAVARGLDKVDINSFRGGKIYITRLRWFFIGNYDSPNLVDTITHKQADAIRDGKLEEFITNLIK